MVGLQRCFVLHARPYRETSLLLDIFSEQAGRLTLVANGARRPRSALKGILQPFTPLFLEWRGRGSLQTLQKAEPISLALPLSGFSLYSAFYVNEVLCRVLDVNTPYPQLFFDYLNALRELAQTPDPQIPLRRFELSLLTHLGYGIDFLHCAGSGFPIEDQMTYLYREQQGFIASTMPHAMSFTGAQLRAIADRQFSSLEQLQAAKRFTRLALKPYIGSKPLKSRELFLPRERSSSP